MSTTSRNLRAGAVVLALATTAVAAPSAFAQSAGVPEIESGSVNWPIKESFNAYIGAAGELTVSEGVERDGNSFNFPVDVDDSELDAEGNGTVELDGKIHYYAHGGGLDLTLDDVKVVVAGTDATITADYVLTGQRPGQDPVETTADDAEIASFTLDSALTPVANETVSQSDLTTTFLDGAGALGYTPGEVVEGGDVDIDLTFGDAPVEEDPSSSAPGDSSESSDDTEGSSEKGGIIAAIIALLAALGAAGAAIAGFIPGLDLGKLDLGQFDL